MAHVTSRLPPPRVLDASTLAGAIKLRCWDKNITLQSLAPVVRLKPQSLRARLSNSMRGKRSLQPWQVSAIAKALALDEAHLHRLAAQQEGWRV